MIKRAKRMILALLSSFFGKRQKRSDYEHFLRGQKKYMERQKKKWLGQDTWADRWFD